MRIVATIFSWKGILWHSSSWWQINKQSVNLMKYLQLSQLDADANEFPSNVKTNSDLCRFIGFFCVTSLIVRWQIRIVHCFYHLNDDNIVKSNFILQWSCRCWQFKRSENAESFSRCDRPTEKFSHWNYLILSRIVNIQELIAFFSICYHQIHLVHNQLTPISIGSCYLHFLAQANESTTEKVHSTSFFVPSCHLGCQNSRSCAPPFPM